jgi:hypothetical protein
MGFAGVKGTWRTAESIDLQKASGGTISRPLEEDRGKM